MQWIPLHSIDQLTQLISESKEPHKLGIMLFKHSTRCATSSIALARIERKWAFQTDKLPAYFLDLLNHRDISDIVSATFNIEHQSPQLLLIQKGNCTFSQTHNGIDVSDLERFIAANDHN